jgi:hypothetical protein
MRVWDRDAVHFGNVVLDNVGLREVEERHGVRHGHGRKVVRGLERYCKVARWLEKRGFIDQHS